MDTNKKVQGIRIERMYEQNLFLIIPQVQSLRP